MDYTILAGIIHSEDTTERIWEGQTYCSIFKNINQYLCFASTLPHHLKFCIPWKENHLSVDLFLFQVFIQSYVILEINFYYQI